MRKGAGVFSVSLVVGMGLSLVSAHVDERLYAFLMTGATLGVLAGVAMMIVSRYAYPHRPSRSEQTFQVINVALLFVLAALALYPFVYTASMSLSTQKAASEPGLHLYPSEVSLMAYRMVLRNPVVYVGYANTLFRTVAGTLLTLLVTCLYAYALSRKDLPHRRFYHLVLLFTMVFHGGIVPTYLTIKGLGLIDNRLVYLLPGLVAAFNVFVVKSFFQQLPPSLGESARIDGASEWRILFSIYVPLSTPVLATVALWTAVSHWNMWFDALIYINSDTKQVMQTFLQRIVIENSVEMIEKGLVNPDITQFTPETLKAATVVVTILPMLALYPFLQRYFVKGITLGGVKE